MILSEIFEASIAKRPKKDETQTDQEQIGTYAAFEVGATTAKQIKNFCEDFNIPNPVDPEDMHCTVIYSRKFLDGFEPQGFLYASIIGTNPILEVWPTQSGKKCLVARIEAPDIEGRHQDLMSYWGATYDFDEFIPHVTISYDIEDRDLGNLTYLSNQFNLYVEDAIEFVREYKEPLDLNRESNNTKGTKIANSS